MRPEILTVENSQFENLGFEHSPFLLLSLAVAAGADDQSDGEVLQSLPVIRASISHATGTSGHQEFMADAPLPVWIDPG